MVSVFIIWIYMAVTTYLAGFGFMSLCPGIREYTVRKVDSYVFAGIAVITVYAQVFSLFSKIGIAAHVLLISICLIIAVGFRKRMTAHLCAAWSGNAPVRILLIFGLLILFAFGASRGIIHYDTGLYHAQSIRWIEEYGIVPGLGNLHVRLAYNSSSLCLSALYSMKFVTGQSFHVCAGFLAFWLAKICVEGIRRRTGHRLFLSDLARAVAVYYLLNIFDEMIAPASDYFMVLLFFYIMIRWLDLLERVEKSHIPYALLCLLCVFLITVKLSGALILVLVIKPVVMMIRGKKYKAIAGYLGLGLLTALPWLIRSVILSGWLIYPFTFLDWFPVDWKIPKGVAEYDSREIQVWGRGYTDVEEYDIPVSEWIGPWFRGQSSIDKLFILAAAGAILVLLLLFCYLLIRKKWAMADQLLVPATVGICFFFWLCSAPLIRYGCVYVWLTPVLTYGYLYLHPSARFSGRTNQGVESAFLSTLHPSARFSGRTNQGVESAFLSTLHLRVRLDRYLIIYILLLLAGGYKAERFGAELWQMAQQSSDSSYLVFQKDYENYPTVSYELHGYTFYYPESGDQTGYEAFPASPFRADDIFRGNTMEEGFCPSSFYDNVTDVLQDKPVK